MKRKDHKRKSVGKVVAGMLVGSVVGATVGWLTAPASGGELRRKITGADSRIPLETGSRVGKGSRRSLQEKIKTSEGNVESIARELAADANENPGEVRKTTARRRNAGSL